MEAKQHPLNHERPVIHRALYEKTPGERWATCEVCTDVVEGGGIILLMRQNDPPHLILHDQYCVLCGQRYHFDSLGEELEEENRHFQNFHWTQHEQP